MNAAEKCSELESSSPVKFAMSRSGCNNCCGKEPEKSGTSSRLLTISRPNVSWQRTIDNVKRRRDIFSLDNMFQSNPHQAVQSYCRIYGSTKQSTKLQSCLRMESEFSVYAVDSV